MFKRSYVVFRLVLESSIFFSKAGFAVSNCRRTVKDMFQSENSEVISSPVKKLQSAITKLSPNKKEILAQYSPSVCGPGCLSLPSKNSLFFRIELDDQIQEAELLISPLGKLLKLNSWDKLEDSSLLKSWLVGHELHPQISTSSSLLYTQSQEKVFQEIKSALNEGASSFLHISPTGTGKTLVLARALKENLKKGLHFVTAHQIHLVEQLYETLGQNFSNKEVTLINWNERENKSFLSEIERAIDSKEPVVFVITTQSLKSLLRSIKRKESVKYESLVKHTKGIYLDEAHHLGAFQTKSVLMDLHEKSGAFFYGSTATPVHHEVNLIKMFEREHWSYLEKADQGEEDFKTNQVLDQLSIAIKEGELTPFDELYIIGEANFPETEEEPLLIQGESDFFVLNPYHYVHLSGMLEPIISSNKKGFIVTANIVESEKLSEFLGEKFEGVKFDPYHSGMTKEAREELLRRSQESERHYIVAVRALDEGMNMSQLSAYVDLNVNVSAKQMVHRMGRVLRLRLGKLGSDILFLSEYRDESRARDLLSVLDMLEASPHVSRSLRRSFSGNASLKSDNVRSLSREALLELRRELEVSVKSFWNRDSRLSMTERKERILELVRKNPKITVIEIAEELELSIGTIKLSIKELKKKRRLLRLGGSKSGSWYIPGEEKDYLDSKEEIKERILELMRENSKITVVEIVKKLELSIHRINRSIKELKKEGRLFRIGNQLSGYWEIPGEGQDYLDPQEEIKERILELVRENSKITGVEIAKELELSISKIYRVIQELKEEERLLRKGSKRDGYWQIPGEEMEYPDPKEKRKERILELMRENPKITVVEIAEKLELSIHRINLSIKELRKEERLSRKGSKRDGSWQIPGEEMEYLDPKEKRKERILKLVKENPKIIYREIAKELDLSISTINRSIKELEEKGRLLRKGSYYWGYWQIPGEGRDYLDPKEERKERVLELMKENPKITVVEIAKELELSKTIIYQMIQELKEEGRLLRKGRKWQIPEKGQEYPDPTKIF